MTDISTNIKVKITKGRKTLYWMSTAFAALALAAIGAADLVRDPKIVEGLVRLGYPAYLATILGIWKLLGSTTLIIPGLPRLKEWAYAGMFFTLTGAAISHVLAGDSFGKMFVPLALLAAVMTSWVLQPARNSGDRTVAMTQRGATRMAVVDTGGAGETAERLFHTQNSN